MTKYKDNIEQFGKSFLYMQNLAHETANKHGFNVRQGEALFVPAKIALITSECSEALKEHRNGNIEGVFPELADIVLRTMDLASAFNCNLATYIIRKQEANVARPYMHNGKRY